MDQRARFEAWCRQHGFPVTRALTGDGYDNAIVQNYWYAWKGCAEMETT